MFLFGGLFGKNKKVAIESNQSYSRVNQLNEVVEAINKYNENNELAVEFKAKDEGNLPCVEIQNQSGKKVKVVMRNAELRIHDGFQLVNTTHELTPNNILWKILSLLN